MGAPRPTPAELEILRVLWERGPSLVRDVQEVINADRRTGYTTVLKLLQIMTDKGLVSRDEQARAHVYSARLPQSQTQRQLVRDLVDRAFRGSAANLVMQALSGRRTSADEIGKIRRLLDDLEGGDRAPAAPGRDPAGTRTMKRGVTLALSALCSGALFLGTARAYVIPPEPLLDLGVGVGGGVEALAGAWTAVASRGPAKDAPPTVQISLRQGRRGTESQTSFTCGLTDLENLTPDHVLGVPRDVSFELARDAGVLRFIGRFQSGEGAGRFTFVPSADFLVGMSTLGYPAIDTEKAYGLATLDVSRRFVQDLRRLGRSGLTLDQLVALRLHGVDAGFIAALQALGYDYLSADRIVSFKIHGVSPEFITQMRALGYGRLGPEDLVSFRIHGVGPEFVRELQALGYRGASPADLLNLQIHGITPDFVRRVNGSAQTGVPVTRLVDLRGRTPKP
jgi:predicted transcriptional regulator